ncbi:mrna turnover protein 4-like protein [Phaffia rhodozyma]|uniref:Ribosome assembly factor mrt4 n=1 Tax=Phaffia rhodozyma TaxID=264483 RepID=A0A0F7SLG1_PHARH|nr:mrna turnover protein 4-like protein [Phaffia rhodozyma]
MPKSKREKVVSLTKTDKKTKQHKSGLIEAVRESADEWTYCWLFNVGDMRNSHLKEVRAAWRGTGRLFFGRNKVMGKALGTTPEDEYKEGLSKVSAQLNGPTGLFFTNHPPKETLEYFESFQKPDFARAGNVAARDVTLPVGPLLMYNDPTSPFPHSMDPQLRKLGLATSLVKGVPSLTAPHVICKKGKVLTAEQAQLLKLCGEMMATFQVTLSGFWCEDQGFKAGPLTAANAPKPALVVKQPKVVEKKSTEEMDDEEDDE